jgi:hypothetical protein
VNYLLLSLLYQDHIDSALLKSAGDVLYDDLFVMISNGISFRPAFQTFQQPTTQFKVTATCK